MNDTAPKDRDIAMVFQNYALYPHMNVYDNMAFSLKIRKFNKKGIQERVNNAAKILGLEPYLQRKPKMLSGGQRQRDRKSTRLNSSHVAISYAVFCLKKNTDSD